jgi:hypothetical protein
MARTAAAGLSRAEQQRLALAWATPWASFKDVQRCALEIDSAGFVSADGLADTRRNAFSPTLPGGAVSLLTGNSPAAALALVFSAVVPDWETRDKTFFAWALFSIGYLRLSGSAKDLAGISFHAPVESFAI